MPIQAENKNTPFDTLELGRYQTLIDVLEQSWQDYPQLPAFNNFGCNLSYRELQCASRDFAAYLQHQTSLDPGDRIAIQLPNLLQYPVVLFGALRAGLVIVNINPLYTPSEMLHQFQDSGAKALVVLANMASKVEEILDQTEIETLIVTEIGDALPLWKCVMVNATVRYLKKMVPDYRLPTALSYRQVMKQGKQLTFESPPIATDDLAMLQYTGGTTGRAKGAMLSHRNLLANMLQVKGLLDAVTVPGREVAIAPLPLYHIYSFTVNCMLMMEIGAQVVLITNPRDIPAFVHELRRWKFTIFSGLNTLFAALCRQPDFHYLNFDRLKLTVSGGMALSKEVAEKWQQATGCPVLEGYGMTETSPIITVNPPDGIRLGTIGLPIKATQVRLIDEEGGEVPVGGSGELCVRGPQVMQGYWNQPQETALVLDAEGWLRTGDIASIDEAGYLTIVDRKKDVINVSGFNVYPNELEAVVLGHPDIIDCVAVGLPDADHGELIKLYVISSNPALTIQQIRGYCRERLTAYKVPSQVEFRSELPKSNIGKVLRRALRDEELQKRLNGSNCDSYSESVKAAPLSLE
ncbi:MAG: AMP-binding protein [Halopseudomonas sp.]